MSPSRREILRKEIYLLKNSYTEPSKSPLASPCLVVSKDYNPNTIKDSYLIPHLNNIKDPFIEVQSVSIVYLHMSTFIISFDRQSKANLIIHVKYDFGKEIIGYLGSGHQP